MTEPNALQEALQRWQKQNHAVRVTPDGAWKKCRTRACPVEIAVGQEREYCYGCGGHPNVASVMDMDSALLGYRLKIRERRSRYGLP